MNPLYFTDSYKLGHAEQYPAGTSVVYSNFTPRSLKHSPIPDQYSDGKIVVFGLSGLLQELVQVWTDGFFNQPKDEVISEFVNEILPFVGPNGFNRERLEFLHDLGYLPIHVRALPEGAKTGIKVPHFTIVNTIPECFWLTNYLETVFSTEAWKSSTVATIANAYKRVLTRYAIQTGSDLDFVDFQAHDFSSRGLSGIIDGSKVGSAHLTSFKGTDTLACLPYLNAYYDGRNTLKGASVPATEHSVMCMGNQESELETFKRLITEIYPNGVVSIVSDTWDFWQVMTVFARTLKDDIMARGPDALGLAKVVFRPDSGLPEDILCGTAIPLASTADISNISNYTFDMSTPHKVLLLSQNFTVVIDGAYHNVECRLNSDRSGYFVARHEGIEPTPEMKGAVECLWDIFGGTITSTGHKLLDSHVGLIYGDAITLVRADEILRRLAAKGFASGNVVLGIGSYSYQYLTRDTFGFAMKATFGVVNGEDRAIFKNPKTDDGTKVSAKGLLRVDKIAGEYVLANDVTFGEHLEGELQTIFKDGKFSNLPTLEGIRTRLIEEG